MRKPSLNKAISEFKEFYLVCWRANKKITFLFTLFIIFTLFDGVRAFFNGKGTAYEVVQLVKSITNIF